MERLLARLERGPLGKLAIENLTYYVVGGMALVFMLWIVKHDTIAWLVFDPALAKKQPWRFVSFLFIPRSLSLFWGVFSILFFHFIGTSLEANWGAFKYNVYYLVGALGTIAAAYITGEAQGNFFLNESVLFAVATIAPNYEIVFFFFPLKLKWVALIALAQIAYEAFTGDMSVRIAIGVSFANYLLFFAGDLYALARGRQVLAKQAVRRASTRSSRPPPAKGVQGRACAICGARQDEGADIRVCSCEKCGKPRELCLEHARNH
jgi:hypothetical protein